MAHALESSTAWPQLDGVRLTAGPVIEAFDEATAEQAWIVPLFHEGKAVAASRFHPFEGHAQLGEVALYQAPRSAFPIPRAGERLVLFAMTCADPWPDSCLFQNSGWRIE